MDNPAPLPPPGNAPERLGLAARLFNEEVAIPVQLSAAASSDTDDPAMADVGATPFTNSIPQIDHWDQLIADGNCPDQVARMKAESLAAIQLDTSQAMESFLSQVASDLPSQAIANSSSPAAIVTQATQVDLASDLYHCS